MRYRIERDSLGERQVPAEAYYGIETLRGKENFEITKKTSEPKFRGLFDR